MKKLVLMVLFGFSAFASAAPLKVGIVGLVHGHVAAFLGGGAMTPAGAILKRPDVELVGIVEPDQALFDSYAKRYHLQESLHFKSIAEMTAQTHLQAVLVFTPPSEHRRVVEECAQLGVNVMMEKPLAFTYDDALAMERAATRGKIHVLVDFETSWYPSNSEANRLLSEGSLGPLVKVVDRSETGWRRRADGFRVLWPGFVDLDDEGGGSVIGYGGDETAEAGGVCGCG
jgi:glucose-fructose oxidoreductase